MATGHGETEKRKAISRRSHRRSKQSISVSGAHSSDIYEDSGAVRYTLLKRPVPNISGDENNDNSHSLTGINSSSPPLPSTDQHGNNYLASRMEYFNSHLPTDEALDAVENGDAFKAVFRANPYNKQEAYCTIEGVPVDIFISGYEAQNRAIHGDMVIIKIDPLSNWTKMKVIPSNNTSGTEDCEFSENLKDLALILEKMSESDYENEMEDQNSLHNLEMGSVNGLCSLIDMFPEKRPTGKVLSIIEKSSHRDSIVGFLKVKNWIYYKKYEKECSFNDSVFYSPDSEYVDLSPTDPRYPKMLVLVRELPDDLRTRLEADDDSVEMDLVAAKMDEWSSESLLPIAVVLHDFGKGSELDAQINSILFKNKVSPSEFPSECVSTLPLNNWEVPSEEIKIRRDLRNSCIFTIDPSSATDLDDALSFEELPNGNIRIGVHIADVSFFVLSGTSLDMEAQKRGTTIYLVRNKIAMLPLILSDNLVSLNPGVNRLAFSIIWDMNTNGEIFDRWIGRSVINSCCKLSYEQVQNIISDDRSNCHDLPTLHGRFSWSDVYSSLHGLYRIWKILRKKRMDDGALYLETSKLNFGSDEEWTVYERKESNFLVEEFMLLANVTVAEVISRSFPECALLRRHPQPHLRKLRELKSFCSKIGFNLDASSSGKLNKSLEQIREKLKNEEFLMEMFLFLASRSMQSAGYFCSGNFRDNPQDWSHYALAVPFYTHFTSPLRRYPDIVVHRQLAAVVDAEAMCKSNSRCFTGMRFDEDAAESVETREYLAVTASKYCVPDEELLSKFAAHCNERKLASRLVKDSCFESYMWMTLRKKKVLMAEATVMGLGPRFMSIFIHKLAIERRIYYNEVDGLSVEWLESTSTLILSYSKQGHRSYRHRSISEFALVVNSCDLKVEKPDEDEQVLIAEEKPDISPAVLPLVAQVFSTLPVALYPIGGDGCAIDVEARLFLSSYFG